jgi:hypothetical protein
MLNYYKNCYIFVPNMLKKIFIYNLLLIFFVSTAGLPFSMHFCSMMGESSVEDCTMCYVEKIEVKKTCCEADEALYEKLSAEFSSACCETKIIDASVKDNFVISKSDLISKVYFSVLIIENITGDLSINSTQKFYSDIPPLLLDNQLYLINSVLLI